MPYVTFNGSIIQANIVQGMASLAATFAEQATGWRTKCVIADESHYNAGADKV